MKRFILALLIAVSAPAFATVSDTSNGRSTQPGDGASVTFFFNYPCTGGCSKDNIQVSVSVAGTPLFISFTTTLNVDQSNEPGGTIFFNTAPPNGASVVIQRVVPFTQGLSLAPFSAFPAKSVERQFDMVTEQVQQLDRDRADLAAKEAADIIAIAGGSNNAPIIATGETTARTPADRFADIRNVKGFGAVQNGSTDDSAAIQSAINVGSGIVFLPGSSSFCYNIGNNTININSNLWVLGEGADGVGQGATCFIYTGTGCAVLADSTRQAHITGIDVRVNSTSSTARAFCIKSTTATAIWNTIEFCSARQINATTHIAGQYGFYLDATGASPGGKVYWNHINNNVAYNWDRGYELRGHGTLGVDADGANNNWLSQNIALSSNVGIELWKATDNVIHGFTCSRSDALFVGTFTCFLLGDASNFADFNELTGLDSDTGSPSVCGVIGASSRGSYISAHCESGGSPTDNNTSIPFPSTIFELLGSKLRIGKITSSGGATFAGYPSPICTTAATIGATCTSGPLTTVITYPDTLYVAICTLNTVTGQPHLVGVTKTSSTTITATIAADTAVAASAKVDCYFNHP